MKIGLFGGTFDPIHWGHLRSAEEVSETFALDRVYFVPASIPPHKRGQTTTPASDRLQMVRLAVARNPRFSTSTMEMSRLGVSYSIDTIRAVTRPRSAAAIRSISLSDWMPFAKLAHGRISPRFFRCVISS